MKRAAIYLKEPKRPSLDRPDAETQMAEVQEYCRVRELEIVAKYRDSQQTREQF